MTVVRVALSVPTADGAGKRPTGTISWRPTKRRTVGDDVVLPAPFNVAVTDPPAEIDVAPTEAGWAWEVVERVSGGSPHKRVLAVPDSADVIDYADLIAVDPATLDPLEEPEAAWWAVADSLAAGQNFIALDDDGVPYFDPDGVQHPIRLFADVDDVLFYTAA